MSGRHKWSELRARMSPEQRARVDAMVAEELKKPDLVALRRQAGLTQQQLADALGLNQGSVSKTENAEGMNISTLRRYLEALGGRLRIAVDLPDGRTIELGDLGGKAA